MNLSRICAFSLRLIVSISLAIPQAGWGMSSHRSLDDELDDGESEHSSSSLSSSSFIGDDEDESNKSDFSDSHGYQDYVLTHPEKFEPYEEEEENSGNSSSRESEPEEEEERKFDKEEAQQLHEIGEKISCININSMKGSTPEEQQIQLLGEDLSRVNIGDSQGTTLIHQTNPLPYFVVNCIYYASSDAETGSDKDGQGSPLASDDGTFSMQDFNSDNYPFKFGNRNKGSAPKVVSDDDNEEVEKTRTGLDVFMKKLSVEAFKDEGDKRLSTVSASILLNRPYSLSQRKNNFLHKYRAPAFREDEIKIDCKTESILWSHGSWVEKNKDKNVVSHKQVRSFYRQLKKRDAKAARKFRKDNEDKTQADIIKIYNTLKDQSTKDKKQFLEENKGKISKELNAKSKKSWNDHNEDKISDDCLRDAYKQIKEKDNVAEKFLQ